MRFHTRDKYNSFEYHINSGFCVYSKSKNRTKGAIVAIRWGETKEVVFGFSVCNYKAGDRFQKSRGFQLAVERAWCKSIHPVPYSIEKDYKIAVNRALKYFKDCNIYRQQLQKEVDAIVRDLKEVEKLIKTNGSDLDQSKYIEPWEKHFLEQRANVNAPRSKSHMILVTEPFVIEDEDGLLIDD